MHLYANRIIRHFLYPVFILTILSKKLMITRLQTIIKSIVIANYKTFLYKIDYPYLVLRTKPNFIRNQLNFELSVLDEIHIIKQI